MARIRNIAIADLPAIQEPALENCYLYVIQEENSSYFKIGIAGHPGRRLSALRSGNRRKLSLVAAYAGYRSDCLYVERVALRFFSAAPGSEWVVAEDVDAIIAFLNAHCGEEA